MCNLAKELICLLIDAFGFGLFKCLTNKKITKLFMAVGRFKDSCHNPHIQAYYWSYPLNSIGLIIGSSSSIMNFPSVVLHTIYQWFLSTCDSACLEVVFEFDWRATYFGFLMKAKLILAPLGLPKWVWTSLNRYRVFLVQTSTWLPPSVHQKISRNLGGVDLCKIKTPDQKSCLVGG